MNIKRRLIEGATMFTQILFAILASFIGLGAALAEVFPGPLRSTEPHSTTSAAAQNRRSCFCTVRHPALINKLVLASTTYKRDGMQPGFFEGLKDASMDKMLPQSLKDAYLEANPDPKGLQAMFDRDAARMAGFQDISNAKIHAIQSPALVINGDEEIVPPEHALALSRTLPHGRLAILPGGHGEYLGVIEAADKNEKMPALVTSMIEEFSAHQPKRKE